MKELSNYNLKSNTIAIKGFITITKLVIIYNEVKKLN